jgi:hypothetical protein
VCQFLVAFGVLVSFVQLLVETIIKLEHLRMLKIDSFAMLLFF